MIQKLKLAIFRTLCRFTALRCRLAGLRHGRRCIINGMPSLRLAKGSRVQLGDEVTLISNPRHNPLLQYPVSIRTLLPEAEVSIASHAGISGSRIVCCTRVSIGEYTIVGPETVIYDSKGHDYDPAIGWKGRKTRRGEPISIGAKCLIGMRCTILKGVSIGDHSVVSAGTVVNRDVPAGHLAFGNPMQLSPLPGHLTR